MINEITFQYPSWYIVLCVLLGLIYAGALYYKDDKFSESPGWSKWVMAFLRMLAVTGISLLLLTPLIKTISEDVKQPIVIIGEDNSQSIVANLTPEATDAKKAEINQIAESLEEKYEVKRLVFGDKIENGAVDSFSSKVTNLSESMEYIYDNFGDQNLGAIILSTDGIYNEGKNPLYSNINFTAPVYIVAQGDTTIQKDLLIKNVFNNKIAYLGDKFSIQVDISAKNCIGNSSTLSVSKVDGSNVKRLQSEPIRINKDNYFNTSEIILDANTVGLNKYRVAISPVNGEVSKANNYKDIFIEVLDARQKIVLLANAPHPDLSAMKSLITTNKNYEVNIHFPEDRDLNLAAYDLVVLHNLPSDKYPMNVEISNMDKKRTPRLFVVGAQTNLARINKVQDNIRIVGNSTSLEDIQADVSPSFNSFTTNPEIGRKLKSFPPLIAPFGQYTSPSGSNVLLTQNIKKIPTKYPLISFKDKDGFKTGVWVGEGLWKWRLFDFLQYNNYDVVTELVNKSVQFLSTKEDKRKFRVSTAKNLYKENEQISFDAQLYNDNYEMINEPDVFLIIVNEEGKEFKYTYSRSNNFYTLSIGMLPSGRYRYTANTNYSGEALTQSGSFSVQNIQLELYDLTARHDLLTAISEKYGGEVVQAGEGSSIVEKVLSNSKIKPVIYQSTETKSVINFKWLFALLMSLLSIEWFLRRYLGSY
ncbi:MAG: hypothetical protein P1U56_05130 [Saprospiraceae bacterium]|nr:hypothetical protein [Saprospiraceae bacterium]